MKIDLNVDIGEGFPFDQELTALATSANVCCGAHAGSRELTVVTYEACRAAGLRLGAHPGLPTPADLGRVWPDALDRDALLRSLRGQVDGFDWDYIKPHGALYTESAKNLEAAELLVEALSGMKLPLMGLAGHLHEKIATSLGVPFIAEAFPERAYRPDGSLVPRTEPGWQVQDLEQIRSQALILAVKAQSLCIHGDRPDCVEVLRAVRSGLEAAGYEVASS